MLVFGLVGSLEKSNLDPIWTYMSRDEMGFEMRTLFVRSIRNNESKNDVVSGYKPIIKFQIDNVMLFG